MESNSFFIFFIFIIGLVIGALAALFSVVDYIEPNSLGEYMCEQYGFEFVDIESHFTAINTRENKLKIRCINSTPVDDGYLILIGGK